MSRIIRLDPAAITPRADSVYRRLGHRDGDGVGFKVKRLFDQAVGIFLDSARPVGLVQGVSREEFGPVFDGEGRNSREAPLRRIYPRAERLALFAVTLGEEVSGRIGGLFDADDFPLGAMLDAVTSLAAERAVEELESGLTGDAIDEGVAPPDYVVLGYSPGYCGWHISAQGSLFEHLQPQRIGISLNESFLMRPLKSVSGVLVGGKGEIHRIDGNYSFCRYCRTRTCRINSVRLSTG